MRWAGGWFGCAASRVLSRRAGEDDDAGGGDRGGMKGEEPIGGRIE